MNNNVTDIFQALKNLEGKISSLEKTVDELQECICNLTRIYIRFYISDEKVLTSDRYSLACSIICHIYCSLCLYLFNKN